MLDYENASVDEVLRDLIGATSLTEVVCCLDMITIESKKRLAMFSSMGREYPAKGGDLTIPTSHMVTVEEVLNEKTINDHNASTDNDPNDASGQSSEKNE